MVNTVHLDLGDRAYDILIGSGLMAEARTFDGLVRGHEVFIVTNDTVGPLYLDRLKDALGDRRIDVISLPDGERFKTIETFESIHTALLEAGHKRSTTVIALGGGVVGDVAGFAAATYQRGVDFIQVPTTLLAQVDSSVGGKTAVNHALGKNMIGAFYQPRAVIIDTDTLVTLPERELSAGLAEVIKHGALADKDYLAAVEKDIDALRRRDAAALTKAISRSCEIKASVVSADEREAGKRALLNFGHTFGHAIEAGLGYGEWLHGEAVGAGMVMAADLSWRLGLISLADGQRLKRIVEAAGLPTAPPAHLLPEFPALMARDKKATESGLTFIVLDALGRARVDSKVGDEVLNQTLGAGRLLLSE